MREHAPTTSVLPCTYADSWLFVPLQYSHSSLTAVLLVNSVNDRFLVYLYLLDPEQLNTII